MEELREYLLREEQQSFKGWDFSYLDGRCEWETLSWDYKKYVEKYLKKDTNLLDMGTGGGEFLQQLHHPYELTSVTEGWEPNFLLCKKTLEPLGVTVKFVEEDERLPYEDEQFDLVLSRHEAFLSEEIKRVLKPGGFFVTQQVGCRNDRELVEKLMEGVPVPFPKHDLVHNVKLLKDAGMTVVEQLEEEIGMKLFDLGAAVYFAKQLPWEFPDFSVEKNYDRIVLLQNELEQKGYISNNVHRFLIVAQKR